MTHLFEATLSATFTKIDKAVGILVALCASKKLDSKQQHAVLAHFDLLAAANRRKLEVALISAQASSFSFDNPVDAGAFAQLAPPNMSSLMYPPGAPGITDVIPAAHPYD